MDHLNDYLKLLILILRLLEVMLGMVYRYLPAWGRLERKLMTDQKREAVLEQAAVALLAEAEKSGVDLEQLAQAAKIGITGNAMYTWIADHEMKAESESAVDYLISSLRANQVK
jgi:hypothetical protein